MHAAKYPMTSKSSLTEKPQQDFAMVKKQSKAFPPQDSREHSHFI